MLTLRLLLTDQVEQMGHEVTAVSNGQEALDLMNQRNFDLVLLDIHMPAPDGFSVLSSIRSDERWRDIPVVMISGIEETEAVVRCIEMGADDFLHKPCDPTLLRARINACLDKKRLHDQREQLFQQLQRNYDELSKLEELRDSLTHMIVHDMRAPLTSVITSLELLEFLPDATPQRRDMLVQMAHNGGQTLLGMINDLLDISKMEAGELQLDCNPISIGELLESATRQVRALLPPRDLQLEQSITPDLPLLWGDAAKLCRVLVNLLSNSIKFSPKGGAIKLIARRIGEQVQFSVQDYGEGIPREAFERIFEKFGQIESRKAGRKLSTGLGLAFCKMAVEAHGGKIWVESEVGIGSTFYFMLPLRQPDEPPPCA